MANSKIKQILVGTTTYDIEDADAMHLSANNTFTGTNTFKGKTTFKGVNIEDDGVRLHSSTTYNDIPNVVLYSTSSGELLIRNGQSYDNIIKFPVIDDSLTGDRTVALLRDIPTVSTLGQTGQLKDSVQDTTHRLVTDTEKSTWNSKQTRLTSKQLNAANSGITATKVSTYDGYATAINNKVDKVTGKGLSTNDFTNDEKNKLAEIEYVKANPTDSGTATLTKLKVGSTTYNIPSGGGGGAGEQLQSQLCEYSVGLKMYDHNSGGTYYFDFSFLSSITDVIGGTGSPIDLIELATAMYYEGFSANYTGSGQWTLNNFVRIAPSTSNQPPLDCLMVGVTVGLGEGFIPGEQSNTNLELMPVFADPNDSLGSGSSEYYKVSDEYKFNIPNGVSGGELEVLFFKKRILNCESIKPPIFG